MTFPSKLNYGLMLLGLWLPLGPITLAPPGAIAQIIPDSTLPTPSTVQSGGDRLVIRDGTQRQGHLFHSFEQFNLKVQDIAQFETPTDVDIIFARVTGGFPSTLEGLIEAQGTAHLVFLNPSGIVFGPQARLNLGGSFLASTATELLGSLDGTPQSWFPSPGNPSPLLRVNVPLGLQLGTGSGPIVVQGPGYGALTPVPSQAPGLAVSPGQTLALVAPSLDFQGGGAIAPQGRLELGGVTLGQVEMEPQGNGWRLNYGTVAADHFGPITFQDQALASAAGGSLHLQGSVLDLRGGATVIAATTGPESGGILSLQAAESLTVTGVGTNGQSSLISTGVTTNATGQGGSLEITTPSLSVTAGGQIRADSTGPGAAGHLMVNADTINVIGANGAGTRFSTLAATSTGTGDSGTLHLQTRRLVVRDGADISVTAFGGGRSGTLTVEAEEEVQLQGFGASADGQVFSRSGLFAATEGVQDGGDLTVVTPRLEVLEGARISVSTRGRGMGDRPGGTAGRLTIQARDAVLLRGVSGDGRFPSGLFALSGEERPNLGANEATGNGGDLTVTTAHLTVEGGAAISSAAAGSGRGGNATVVADTLTITGGQGKFASSLAATSQGSGGSGNLSVTAHQMRVLEGGQVLTGTAGTGPAGDLTVVARDLIEITGTDPGGRPSLLSAETQGAGQGGNLHLTTARLFVHQGGIISASTLGEGNSGSLILEADQIDLEGQGELQEILPILFEAEIQEPADFGTGLFALSFGSGDAGTLRLRTDRLTMTQSAFIATSAFGAGRGGNLDIQADTIDLTGAEICTGAFDLGNAGNVLLRARRINLTEGGGVFASTFGTGNGGQLAVEATERLVIDGTTPNGVFNSGLGVNSFGAGSGGVLRLEAPEILMTGGAGAGAVAFGEGPGGVLILRGDRLELRGSKVLNGTERALTNLSTQSQGTGAAGDIEITTGELVVADGATILTSTLNQGQAGRLTIRAGESIVVQGQSAVGTPSSLRSDANLQANPSPFRPVNPQANVLGGAGDITLLTPQLLVQDGSEIAVSSLGAGESTGNLEIQADRLRLERQGALRAEARRGSGGDIRLTTQQLQLGDRSQISTNAQGEATGGNITLTTDLLVAQGNSDITANATASAGGRVVINALGIFGTDFREALTPDSDITATGPNPELNGTVEIQTPDADPGKDLARLPNAPTPSPELTDNRCTQPRGSEVSSFTVTGRGGLPLQPGTFIHPFHQSWLDLAQGTPPRTTAFAPMTPAQVSPLREAQGWQLDAQGNVQLVADRPLLTLHPTAGICQTRAIAPSSP